MRSIRIPWTAVLVVVLAAVPAWTLPREAVHPSDDTEVFTGAEETARGATPARPALGYWKVRLTLRVPATERAVRVGVLMPLSAGPQDAVAVLAARRGTSLGRARTLTALLQAAGVPARLVGGLRLGTAAEKRATNSWVEAWTGSRWIPLDPAGGYFATLPTSYLALYRGDLPLIVHTAGLDVDYGFAIRQATCRAVEEGEEEEDVALTAGRRPVVRGAGRQPVETHSTYVSEPVASVVLIADQSVPEAVTDRILGEAHDAAINCVLLTARFESRYFRESYLERLVATNLPLIRQAHVVLVATADDAGLYALLGLGERNVRLDDARIIAAGAMGRPAALMLGSLLYHLIRPGEVVLVNRHADLVPLLELARANLIDGTPIAAEAARW